MPYWLQSKDTRSVIPHANRLFDRLTHDWRKKRPIWVMLLVNSLSESDIKNFGISVLDQYLANTARQNQKYVGAVEDVEEQCKPLNSLNASQVSSAKEFNKDLQVF